MLGRKMLRFHKVLVITTFCLVAIFLFPIHPVFFWVAAATGVYLIAMKLFKKIL
jgi:hypothetical protein